MEEPLLPEPDYRSGYVTIIGEPNVGKSTLLNALLEQKLSIVTARPQTTRQRVLGILSGEGYQIIFLDTPGILKPRYQLQTFMDEEVRRSLADANMVMVLVDAAAPFSGAEDLEKRLAFCRVPRLLVINKVDLVRKEDLLPVMEKWHGAGAYDEIIPVSALQGDGVDRVRECLVQMLPAGPPYYPDDIVADAPERFFAAELVRETVFELMKDEIPYSTAVRVEPFKKRGKKIFVHADIFMERDSQKGMMIGKKGVMLKKIGSISRKKIEDFLQQEIFLEIQVKVNRDWKKDKKALKRLGYRAE